MLFYHEGGVDVGDVDAKGVRLSLNLGEEPTIDNVIAVLLVHVPESRQKYLAGFIVALIKLFRDLNFVCNCVLAWYGIIIEFLIVSR